MGKNPDLKHILLSGGTRGLGLALVQALLEAGYAVSTFARRDSSELAELRGAYPLCLHFGIVDVTGSDSLRMFVGEAVSRFGEVYGVINNSAVVQDGVLATLPEVEISRMLAVNLEGALRLSRLGIRSMLKRKRGGRILNVTSIIGLRGYTGLAVYSATKAGLDGVTRSLSRELGPRGITVNSIAPGYMQTDLSAGLAPEQLGQIERRTPLGRLATVAYVVPLAVFLLSSDAAMITGQTVMVDGGIST
jgi:3-oxoacyl-[acyl-carrier protein] reductase